MGQINHVAQKVHCVCDVFLDVSPVARISEAVYPAKVLRDFLSTGKMQRNAIDTQDPSGGSQPLNNDMLGCHRSFITLPRIWKWSYTLENT